MKYVRFTPKSGHLGRGSCTSAYDPKAPFQTSAGQWQEWGRLLTERLAVLDVAWGPQAEVASVFSKLALGWLCGVGRSCTLVSTTLLARRFRSRGE